MKIIRQECSTIGRETKEPRKYFKCANWSNFIGAKRVEDKWNIFLDIYNEGVRRHVPKMCEKAR